MRQRIVGEQVVAYHAGLLQRTLQDAPQEDGSRYMYWVRKIWMR